MQSPFLEPVKARPPPGWRGSSNMPDWAYKAESAPGSRQVQLWHFILELLQNDQYQDVIAWQGEYGEFVIKDPDEVAKLWGIRKCKPHMNYDKLSRALRYYYNKRILYKTKGKRFTYQFNFRELATPIGLAPPLPSTHNQMSPTAAPGLARRPHHPFLLNPSQTIIRAQTSLLNFSPSKCPSSENVFSSQDSPLVSPVLQPIKPMRKLLGSVSDGSDESLAISEADSESGGTSRQTAPISPLVGPADRRKYYCQPSMIPGHFRHVMLPGSVMNHLYAPGSPGLLVGSPAHGLHGSSQTSGTTRLPLNLYPGSLPTTPTYLGFPPSPSFSPFSPGFSPAQTASPGLRSKGTKLPFFSFDVDDIKAYHSRESSRSTQVPASGASSHEEHTLMNGAANPDAMFRPMASHSSSSLSSFQKSMEQLSSSSCEMIRLQNPPLTKKRSNIADGDCVAKQVKSERCSEKPTTSELLMIPKLLDESYLSKNNFDASDLPSEDERIDVETVSNGDDPPQSSSDSISVTAKLLTNECDNTSTTQANSGSSTLQGTPCHRSTAPPKLRFKGHKTEDVDVSEHFGNSLSLNSPSIPNKAYAEGTPVFTFGAVHSGLTMGSTSEGNSLVRPKSGHRIRDILGTTSSDDDCTSDHSSNNEDIYVHEENHQDSLAHPYELPKLLSESGRSPDLTTNRNSSENMSDEVSDVEQILE